MSPQTSVAEPRGAVMGVAHRGPRPQNGLKMLNQAHFAPITCPSHPIRTFQCIGCDLGRPQSTCVGTAPQPPHRCPKTPSLELVWAGGIDSLTEALDLEIKGQNCITAHQIVRTQRLNSGLGLERPGGCSDMFIPLWLRTILTSSGTLIVYSITNTRRTTQ